METREQWLTAAAKELRPLFPKKVSVPKVWVSIGFPHKGALSKRWVAGVCVPADMTSDHIPQIYISPRLVEVEGPCGVLACLTHEMIHACGIWGHGKDFQAIALYVGLRGKMTATEANEDLQSYFVRIIEKLGPMPYAYVNVLPATSRPDRCRMKKCICMNCGYTVRISQKWISRARLLCPRCAIFLSIQE